MFVSVQGCLETFLGKLIPIHSIVKDTAEQFFLILHAVFVFQIARVVKYRTYLLCFDILITSSLVFTLVFIFSALRVKMSVFGQILDSLMIYGAHELEYVFDQRIKSF